MFEKGDRVRFLGFPAGSAEELDPTDEGLQPLAVHIVEGLSGQAAQNPNPMLIPPEMVPRPGDTGIVIAAYELTPGFMLYGVVFHKAPKGQKQPVIALSHDCLTPA